MAQNWNNVLSYIKLELGAGLNLLEFSDEDIIENLKDHVLPYFSQYIPYKAEILLQPSMRIYTGPGENKWKYKIPLDPGLYITDIYDVYINTSMYNDHDFDPFYGTKYSRNNVRGSITNYGDGGYGLPFGGLINTIMTSQYLDMLDYVSVKNTWEFYPPNIIAFDCEISNALVVYNTVHDTLDTIQPDFYDIFKELCLVKIMDWVIALRSKYESISTPVSEIRMNWQRLEDLANSKRQEVQQKLESIPLDKFIEVV